MKGILQSMAFLQIMHFDKDLCNRLSWFTMPHSADIELLTPSTHNMLLHDIVKEL